MGKPIMHSARALFLTFLALEKSKKNNTLYEDFAASELREGRNKICSGEIVPQQCIPKSRDKICSGAERRLCRSSASRKVGTRSAAEQVYSGAKNSNNS